MICEVRGQDWKEVMKREGRRTRRKSGGGGNKNRNMKKKYRVTHINTKHYTRTSYKYGMKKATNTPTFCLSSELFFFYGNII